MKWWDNQLRNAVAILETYNGQEPFHLHLRRAFKQLRAGSKDRRTLRAMCYAYLRLARLLKGADLSEAIVAAWAIIEANWSDQLLYLLDNENNKNLKEQQEKSPWERLLWYAKANRKEVESIFPEARKVSSEVDRDSILKAILEPRDVFIWCKGGSRDKIGKRLAKHGIEHTQINELGDAFKLGAGVDLDKALGPDIANVEVQDISSQLALAAVQIEDDATVWDCCAGSGGKSMHLADRIDGPVWLVSDRRESILPNLKKRMRSVTRYFASAAIDVLTNEEDYLVFNKRDDQIHEIGKGEVDCLIVDVPCTGSGTWARNPEFLKAFESKKIADYSKVQQGIVQSAIKFLKKGGKLIYMTCSVYARENENVIEALLAKNPKLTISKQGYYGENHKGDILYKCELILS